MKDINFFKFHGLFLVLSLACVVAMLVLLGVKGVNYGTDFKGGLETVVVIEDASLTAEDLRQSLEAEGLSTEVQKILTRENTYIIRFAVSITETTGVGENATTTAPPAETTAGTDIAAETPLTTNNILLVDNEVPPPPEEVATDENVLTTPVSQLRKALMNQYGETASILQSRLVGSVLSSENRRNSILMSLVVIVLIIGYLTLRFELPFAFAAIFAVIYDVSVIFGFVLLWGSELTILTIVAILTIFGYSVNDTIVLFDRIREEKGHHVYNNYRALVNFSINRVLGRTLITSLTTLAVVFSLYISTTGDYKVFSLVLMVGLLSGTYSSIYIAPAFLFFWHQYVRDLLSAKKV